MNLFNVLGKAGALIGRGLIAGAAGTAALTISQIIERQITGKPGSFEPGDAASKALGIEASNMRNRRKLSNEIHWAYGTLWGAMRGILGLAGLKGWPASATHFAAIYYTAITVEPDFEVAPPLNEWSKSSIAAFAFHHAVYASVAGYVFDKINKESLPKDKSSLSK